MIHLDRSAPMLGTVFHGGIRMPALKPDCHVDGRGYFMETWNERDLSGVLAREFSLECRGFVQDNESWSRPKVVRGLHWQKGQSKLVRVVSGRIVDFMVDVRDGSDTFGDFDAVILSGDNFRQVYVPDGWAHGFLALESSKVAYKVDSYWDPSRERGARWDDPSVGLPLLLGKWFDWFDPAAVILSEKDAALPPLQ